MGVICDMSRVWLTNLACKFKNKKNQKKIGVRFLGLGTERLSQVQRNLLYKQT